MKYYESDIWENISKFLWLNMESGRSKEIPNMENGKK